MGHAERLCKHVRRFVDRVRVYHEGGAKLLGGSCKLAENKDASLIIARTHKFLRDEVHSVMEAPNVTEISGAVRSCVNGARFASTMMRSHAFEKSSEARERSRVRRSWSQRSGCLNIVALQERFAMCAIRVDNARRGHSIP
jgi:hypothetical protein